MAIYFTEVCKQEYAGNNCKFSSGFVSGAKNPSDILFLKIEKDMPDGKHHEHTFVFRPDEMAAIAFVASGAIWSDSYQQFERLESLREMSETVELSGRPPIKGRKSAGRL